MAHPARAARLLGAAAAMREETGSNFTMSFVPGYVPASVTAPTRLGDDAFAAAWEAGHRLTSKQAVAEALAADPFPPTATVAPKESGAASRSRLTPREREVLRLLVEGHTDREIAEALFIGRRTVEDHVGNIFDKLDLDSRTAVAAYAVRHGLV
jgi:DNA-binding NarL/FixJ family response regulator